MLWLTHFLCLGGYTYTSTVSEGGMCHPGWTRNMSAFVIILIMWLIAGTSNLQKKDTIAFADFQVAENDKVFYALADENVHSLKKWN